MCCIEDLQRTINYESGVPFVTQVLSFGFAFVAIGRHRDTVQSLPGKYSDNEKVVMHCNTNLTVKKCQSTESRAYSMKNSCTLSTTS